MPTIAQLNQKYSKATITPQAPPPGKLEQATNFVKNFAAQTGHMIVIAGTRIGQAGVQTYNEFQNPGYDTPADYGNPQRQNAGGAATPLPLSAPIGGVNTSNSEANIGKPQQILGSNIPAQHGGVKGAEQIAGQGIEAAGTIGGLAMGGTLNPEAGIGTRFLQGAAIGAPAGGLIGGGQAMENGGSATDVATGTGQGAVGGAVTGGVLNAVLPPVFGKISKMLNPSDTNIVPGETNVVAPKTGSLAEAETARTQAAQQGVNALQNMQQQVGEFKSGLGTQFQQGAATIEKANPTLRLNLTNKQIDALNSLKESKSFSLPDYIDQGSKQISVGGKPLDLGTMNPNIAAQIQKEMGTIEGQTGLSLTPTQAQDLITQLNKGTFQAKASGQLAVNQQMIEITNDIKNSAGKTFGPEWKNVYANYAKGVTAVEKLNDIVNLDKSSTPTDINKNLNSLLKLGETPEGKIILRNSIDEFKQTSGIDLSDPVKAAHQILDKQIALEDAQAKATKGGFVKQFSKGATDPKYLGKRLVEGAVVSILAIGWLRALAKKAGIAP